MSFTVQLVGMPTIQSLTAHTSLAALSGHRLLLVTTVAMLGTAIAQALLSCCFLSCNMLCPVVWFLVFVFHCFCFFPERTVVLGLPLLVHCFPTLSVAISHLNHVSLSCFSYYSVTVFYPELERLLSCIVVAEDWSSVPNTHVRQLTCNFSSSSGDLMPLASDGTCIHM